MQGRRSSSRRRMRCALALAALAVLGAGTIAQPASANHSWNGYHWPRTQNPFTLKLGDNVNASWDTYLRAASADWSLDQADSSWFDATPPPASEYIGPNPLNTLVVTGGTAPRKCRSTTARIEVCNAAYGNNGWLGVASVWASGTHITKATVKLNDTYYATARYNTPAWRQAVVCQEVGHTFGLDHQDESGADLDTCMDYSTVPNIHPDQHDYNELALIYQHTDSTSGGSVQAARAASEVRRLDRDLYVERYGDGQRRFVWVFWKNPDAGHGIPKAAGLRD